MELTLEHFNENFVKVMFLLKLFSWNFLVKVNFLFFAFSTIVLSSYNFHWKIRQINLPEKITLKVDFTNYSLGEKSLFFFFLKLHGICDICWFSRWSWCFMIDLNIIISAPPWDNFNFQHSNSLRLQSWIQVILHICSATF